tara:strand:+ start:756 stop:1439 length:684 start_codon:yes stop_codon:yes gene_type:complete
MDKEKYLIFAPKLTSEDVDNSDLTVQTTTSLVNPVSLLNATSGTDGILEVQLKAHSGHTWGSAYGSVDAGTYYTINSSGYTVHASNGIVTIIAASSDAVNGVTLDASDANNDFRFNLLQHIAGAKKSMCFPASRFRGMQLVNDTTTDLYFDATTGDLDDVDVILVTHAAGKFKELAEMVNDAMSSSAPSVVNFFIGGNSGATGTTIDPVVFNNNPAGITDIAITQDT